MRCLFPKSMNSTKQKVEKIRVIMLDKHRSHATNALALKFQTSQKVELTTLTCEPLIY